MKEGQRCDEFLGSCPRMAAALGNYQVGKRFDIFVEVRMQL